MQKYVNIYQACSQGGTRGTNPPLTENLGFPDFPVPGFSGPKSKILNSRILKVSNFFKENLILNCLLLGFSLFKHKKLKIFHRHIRYSSFNFGPGPGNFAKPGNRESLPWLR